MARGGGRPAAKPTKIKATARSRAKAEPTEGESQPSEVSLIPLDLQQKCLDIFRDALRLDDDDTKVLQEVKAHLYNRDFAAAFGKEDYLRVYASRWSPSRALAYLAVFSDLEKHSGLPLGAGDGHAARVVCLGGGAGGELVALGAWLSTNSPPISAADSTAMQVDLIDIADWKSVVDELFHNLTTPPVLSKYASQAKKDSNCSLVPTSALDARAHRLDVLSDDGSIQEKLRTLLLKADVVMFMFTLNELYSTSVPKTQALLERLRDGMKAGAHILVVDSPGSYSTVSLNGAEKKYPMQWLLDHTMLGSPAAKMTEATGWEKVLERESSWFRLDKSLKYPTGLEDMRYQTHLFKKS